MKIAEKRYLGKYQLWLNHTEVIQLSVFDWQQLAPCWSVGVAAYCREQSEQSCTVAYMSPADSMLLVVIKNKDPTNF